MMYSVRNVLSFHHIFEYSKTSCSKLNINFSLHNVLIVEDFHNKSYCKWSSSKIKYQLKLFSKLNFLCIVISQPSFPCLRRRVFKRQVCVPKYTQY